MLGASAVGLVVVEREQLTSILDRGLEQRADQLVEALTTLGDSTVVANSNAEDRGVQVVDAETGEVLTATANFDGLGPLADPPPPGRTQVARTVPALPIDDDRFRVLSRRVDTADGAVILHVFENIDDLTDAVRGLAVALATAVPLVVLVMTGLVWWLVGRTLRPVEDIRSEVTAITGNTTGGRVTVPPHDDEIGRLAQTMNDMLDRLEASADRQRRFVSDASHELRTPLTRMRAELEIDLEQPGGADLAATHRSVLEETIALQRLVDDLLYLARSDAAPSPLRTGPLDLDDVVMREVDRLRSLTSLRFDTRALSAAHLRGDADQLTRVVRNVLDNAVRHAEAIVTIELTETDEEVRFVVVDDGPGVEVGQEDAIFERFTRLDGSRTRTDGGTGLGLAISRDIAERHHGALTVRNVVPRGAAFTLSLPIDGQPLRSGPERSPPAQPGSERSESEPSSS